MAHRLESLFNPKSVAIIGASGSTNKFKFSERPLRNLIKHGYKGKIYPINPQYETLNGLDCYKSVKDVPNEVETAIIVLPAKYTLDAVKECAEKGVKAVLICSSGFAETGKEGKQIQEKMVEIARENGMIIAGPNTNGIISPLYSTVLSFSPICEKPLKSGNVGIVSQSGNITAAIIKRLEQQNIGIALSAVCGNESDVGLADYLSYMASIQEIRSIVMFIESIRNPDEFLKAVEIARKNNKNLFALKIGKTEASSRAASAHTGALVGSDAIYDTVFQRDGIVRVRDIEELACAIKVSEYLNQEHLNQLGILAFSGGHSSLVADRCADYQISTPEFTTDTKNKIAKLFSHDKNVLNPLDIEGKASEEGAIYKMLSILAEDSSVGGVIFCLGPMYEGVEERIANEIIDVQKIYKEKQKPLYVYVPAGVLSDIELEIYNQSEVMVFYNLDSLLNTISVLGNKLASKQESYTPSLSEDVVAKIRELVSGESSAIDEYQGKVILNQLGIPVAKGFLAHTKAEVLESAEKIGYPVVIKAISPDILHKTEAGIVKVNVKTPEQLSQAYETIISNFHNYSKDAHLRGLLVEEMFNGDMEIIIGIKNDPSFGPMIMVGAGGIFTEVFNDITTRMVPINEEEALQMLKELKYSKILQGFRGKKAANLHQLAGIISKLSILSYYIKDLFLELELNPVIISSSSQMCKAVDMLLTLNKEKHLIAH